MRTHGVVSGMEADHDELIILLCTRAGAIMEDASVVAVTLGALNASARPKAIAELMHAAEAIVSLLKAAQALGH